MLVTDLVNTNEESRNSLHYEVLIPCHAYNTMISYIVQSGYKLEQSLDMCFIVQCK